MTAIVALQGVWENKLAALGRTTFHNPTWIAAILFYILNLEMLLQVQQLSDMNVDVKNYENIINKTKNAVAISLWDITVKYYDSYIRTSASSFSQFDPSRIQAKWINPNNGSFCSTMSQPHHY